MTKAREIAELGQKLTVDGSGNIDVSGTGFFDGIAVGTATGLESTKLNVQRQQGTVAQMTTTDHGENVYLQFSAEDDGGTARTGQVFFDPDANSIGFRNGGVNVLHVKNTGNVGIKKTSPVASLDVGGSIVVNNTESLDPDLMAAGSMTLGQNSDGSGWGLTGIGWTGGSAGQTASFGYAAGNYYFGLGDGTNSNSLTSVLQMSRSETIFNNAGLNTDFRVESSGNANMLFVDASLNQVRIGSGTVNAPSTYPFISYAGGTSGRSAFVHAAGDGGVVISGSAGGSQAALIMGNNWGTNGATFSEEWRMMVDGSNDSLQFKHSGSTTSLYLASSGYLGVNKSGNPAAPINVQGASSSTQPTNISNLNGIQLDGSISNTSYEGITYQSGGGGGAAMVFYRDSGYGTGMQFYTNNTATSGNLSLRTQINTAGALQHYGEAIFNEGSADSDFRVESDSYSGMLHVDAGNNSVNIGTTTSYGSGYFLNVNGKARINTGGSTPDNTSDSGFKGLLIQGGNQRLNIDVSNASNGGAYIQARHQAVTTYPDAFYDLKLNPLGGRVIINEAGHTNADFRAETSADTEKFFIDAGANEIKMGLGNDVNSGLQFMGGGSERLNINYNGAQKVAIRAQSAPGGNDTDVLAIQTHSNGQYYDRMKFTRNGAIIEQPGSPNTAGILQFMRKQHFYGASAFNNPTLDLVSGNINTAAYAQCMIYIKCYQMGVAQQRALITEAMASIGGNGGTFYATAIDGFSHVKNVNTSLGLGSLAVITSGTAWTLQWTGNRVTNYDKYWLEVEVIHHQGMSNVAFAL